jgi:hypothetical protein
VPRPPSFIARTRAIAKFSPTQKKQNGNATASKYSSSLQEQPTAGHEDISCKRFLRDHLRTG